MAELAQLGAGLAEQAATYFTGVNQAIEQGASVLEAALAVRNGEAALLGSTVTNPESFDPVARELFSMVGKGVELFIDMHEAGVIEAPVGFFELAEQFSDTSGVSDADDADPAAAGPLAGALDGLGVGPEGTQQPDVSEETRFRQEQLLVEIFGDDKADVIADLSQAEMVEIAGVVKAVYLQVPIGTRGKTLQPERAQQFEEYIRGDDLQDMADTYGLQKSSFRVNFKTAVGIMHKGVPQADLAAILDKSVAQLRATQA